MKTTTALIGLIAAPFILIGAALVGWFAGTRIAYGYFYLCESIAGNIAPEVSKYDAADLIGAGMILMLLVEGVAVSAVGIYLAFKLSGGKDEPFYKTNGLKGGTKCQHPHKKEHTEEKL